MRDVTTGKVYIKGAVLGALLGIRSPKAAAGWHGPAVRIGRTSYGEATSKVVEAIFDANGGEGGYTADQRARGEEIAHFALALSELN